MTGSVDFYFFLQIQLKEKANVEVIEKWICNFFFTNNSCMYKQKSSKFWIAVCEQFSVKLICWFMLRIT